MRTSVAKTYKFATFALAAVVVLLVSNDVSRYDCSSCQKIQAGPEEERLVQVEPLIPKEDPPKIWVLKGDEEFMKLEEPNCLESAELFGGLKTQICIKKKAEWISGDIAKTGGWELGLVNTILKTLTLYPDAVLLDLGANVGMFSLAAAAMKRTSIAVDPVFENQALIKEALERSGNREHGILMYNGISNSRMTLYPYLEYNDNDGAVRLVTKEEIKNQDFVIAPPVETVLLQDILSLVNSKTAIIKIDVEGFECKALQGIQYMYEKTGIFIPYILIEWVHVKGIIGQCKEDPNGIARNLFMAGYYPAHPETFAPLHDPLDTHWDVLWVHRNAMDLSCGFV